MRILCPLPTPGGLSPIGTSTVLYNRRKISLRVSRSSYLISLEEDNRTPLARFSARGGLGIAPIWLVRWRSLSVGLALTLDATAAMRIRVHGKAWLAYLWDQRTVRVRPPLCLSFPTDLGRSAGYLGRHDSLLSRTERQS